MTRVPSRNEGIEAAELLEDDEDEDTGIIRIRYEQNMERLAAKRVDIAKLKRNIPLPDKP